VQRHVEIGLHPGVLEEQLRLRVLGARRKGIDRKRNATLKALSWKKTMGNMSFTLCIVNEVQTNEACKRKVAQLLKLFAMA
jgi:hypothetical protein